MFNCLWGLCPGWRLCIITMLLVPLNSASLRRKTSQIKCYLLESLSIAGSRQQGRDTNTSNFAHRFSQIITTQNWRVGRTRMSEKYFCLHLLFKYIFMLREGETFKTGPNCKSKENIKLL